MTTREKQVLTGRVGGFLSGKTRARLATEYTARVRWAFEAILRANPMATLQGIAEALNAHCIPTRTGARWGKNTVRAQLLRMGLYGSRERFPHVYLRAA